MEPRTGCDIAIIGSGPAGTFAAIELARIRPKYSIVMFEKGPLRSYGDRDNKTCGWGGSGAYSDGKLDLTHLIGGTLVEKGYVSVAEFTDLMRYVEATYVSYCKDAETVLEIDENPEVERMRKLCENHDMQLIPFPVRHLGTDRSFAIVMGMYQDLTRAGVSIRTQTEVTSINPCADGFRLNWEQWEENTVEGRTEKNIIAHGEILASKVVVCPGREGDRWFSEEARRLGLQISRNRVDIGVRVEVPAHVTKKLTDILHEPKIVFHTPSFKDRVRTFCVCPNGFVVRERYRNLGVVTVNGESNSKRGLQTSSTNFALLVSQAFTTPFDDPVGYAVSVAKDTNRLAGENGILVQRLGDIGKHRSTEKRMRESIEYGFIEQTLLDATPGDLTLAVPHRHFDGILQMLKALEWMAPGIASPHTLLYGAEVKFYSLQVKAGEGFETDLKGLYVAGDGSGYTRGLMQSSIQGVIVARNIAKKLFQE